MNRPSLTVALAIPLSVAMACGQKTDTGGSAVVPGNPVATSWALEDVNPTSPTFEQVVSPADLIGQVSVWYFGHST